MERLSQLVGSQDQPLNDLRALARRGEARIAELSEQLSRSQAELESMSLRFSQAAAEIPADVDHLGDRLCGVLNAAMAEAEEIRAEAHQFAEATRVEAEERAARIIAEAKLEYQAAAKLWTDLLAQSKQVRTDITRLREQATLEGSKILAEAEALAGDVLSRVQRDVDAQIAVAQTKLDELNQVRAKTITQLKFFYDKFTALESPVREVDPVRTIFLTPVHSDTSSAHGAHSACDAGITHELLDGVG
ncbi:hypothetical protein MSIMFB_00808 [Mycobacterium simulans]|uniref:Uncharacterized protein n=2 Tax=Mycobacterium simulans TaxID=627089 RepID=A0A7Z7IGX2_9MYCO|nr:hypothetical protein MSIMFB_00808 [Mycobacterium simulans]SON63818.1 hypothetical protein MSIMFI_05349 [Mycobacterium simulans]